MAEKKKRPKSAAEKAANDALTRAQQLALAHANSRVQGATKGAVKTRKLRASGTDLMQYNLARFTDDPFPDLPGGYGPGPGVASRNNRPTAPTSAMGKSRAKAQARSTAKNERRGDIRGPINTELREDRERREQEAAAKEAARRAKLRAAESSKRKRKSGQTVKKTGGAVIS